MAGQVMSKGRETSAASERWRLLPTHVGETAKHMILTDLLVRGVKTRGPTLWWHATATPTLLAGPSVKRDAKWALEPLGMPLVTRPTGGAAVLAGPGLLGLDIALPASHFLVTGDVVEDYAWIGRVWASALTSLGVAARSLSIAEAHTLTHFGESPACPEAALACFATYSPYEVVSGQRKILGLSQVRRNGGVLYSCAVHINLRPAELVNVLSLSVPSRRRLATHLSRYAASIDEVAPYPVSGSQVMAAFRGALWTEQRVRLKPAGWTRSEIAATQPGTPRSNGNRSTYPAARGDELRSGEGSSRRDPA